MYKHASGNLRLFFYLVLTFSSSETWEQTSKGALLQNCQVTWENTAMTNWCVDSKTWPSLTLYSWWLDLPCYSSSILNYYKDVFLPGDDTAVFDFDLLGGVQISILLPAPVFSKAKSRHWSPGLEISSPPPLFSCIVFFLVQTALHRCAVSGKVCDTISVWQERILL